MAIIATKANIHDGTAFSEGEYVISPLSSDYRVEQRIELNGKVWTALPCDSAYIILEGWKYESRGSLDTVAKAVDLLNELAKVNPRLRSNSKS